MRNIKDYTSFIETNKSKVDNYTIKFINSEISESDFINYLNNEYKINESLIDRISDKILDVLFTFLIRAKEIGFKIIDKLKSVLNWVIKTIENFKKKNPVLYKIIVITIIVIIILIISTSTAHAAVTNTPVDVDKINMAIGFLQKLRTEGSIGMFDSGKAIAYLVDIRDGNMQFGEINQSVLDIANSAIRSIEVIGKDATQTKNENLVRICIDFMNKGREVLGAVLTKSDSTETIKLIYRNS
jgi:hypothetical protein